MRKFSVRNFMKFVGAVSMIAVLAWVGVSFLEVNMKNGTANPNYSKANAFENFYQMMVKQWRKIAAFYRAAPRRF